MKPFPHTDASEALDISARQSDIKGLMSCCYEIDNTMTKT